MARSNPQIKLSMLVLSRSIFCARRSGACLATFSRGHLLPLHPAQLPPPHMQLLMLIPLKTPWDVQGK